MPQYERRYGIRHWKGIGARAIGHNDTKALLVVPIWPGERVLNMRLQGNAGLTSANSWESPELNWTGLAIPAMDHSFHTTGDNATTQFALPANVDRVLKECVVGTGTGTVASGDAYGSDDSIGDENTADSGRAIPGRVDIWSGSSVYQWFKREKLMKPVNATTYMDIFDTKVKRNFHATRPTYLIFGAYRFQVAVTEEFNAQYMMDLAIDIEGGQAQYGWHPEWVETQLSPFMTDTDEDSDDVTNRRRLLQVLQGDNFIESATVSDDSADVVVKADITISTPIKSPLIGSA